jgi:hypothetical protein
VISDGADAAVALALHDTAAFILTLIRVYAPVKTGWLRDSYKKESLSLLHTLIGSMVNYSVFQEFGTSTQSGTPHIIPAFNQSGLFFQDRLIERLKNLG